MNHRNFFHTIWSRLLTIILLSFILLSANSLLPLKWRFPSWRLSPNLELKDEITTTGARTDYVDKNGNITLALDKNYASINRIIDQDNNCILEQYLDDHGNPVFLIDGFSALRKEYNNEGQLISSTFLDDKLAPIVCKPGYASIRRTFNKSGNIETEMYYDALGFPTQDLSKRYGVRYMYNKDMRISVILNLDFDGEIMNNVNRFAYIERTYTSDGNLYMERYYDKDGNPAKLISGQYGYIYENKKVYCIDQNGDKVFMLRHYLLRSMPLVLLIGAIIVLLSMVSGRVITWIIFCLYTAFIIDMTIFNRGFGNSIVSWSIPPNYYLFITDKGILANIWLFIPFGAILYKLSHMWEIIVIPAVLSLIIETLQLVFTIGAFELSDLIANSLGGIIGVITCCLLEPLLKDILKKH